MFLHVVNGILLNMCLKFDCKKNRKKRQKVLWLPCKTCGLWCHGCIKDNVMWRNGHMTVVSAPVYQHCLPQTKVSFSAVPASATSLLSLLGVLKMAGIVSVVLFSVLLSGVSAGVFFNQKQPCYVRTPRRNDFGLQ